MYYATRDSAAGLAKGGEDYTATSGTLTFAPGETSKTITIEILGDDIYEGLERFVTELSSPSGATLPQYPGQTIEIVSDEAVPTAQMAPVTLNEGGGTMTLTLRLSHPSGEQISYRTIDDQITEVTGTATEVVRTTTTSAGIREKSEDHCPGRQCVANLQHLHRGRQP